MSSRRRPRRSGRRSPRTGRSRRPRTATGCRRWGGPRSATPAPRSRLRSTRHLRKLVVRLGEEKMLTIKLVAVVAGLGGAHYRVSAH